MATLDEYDSDWFPYFDLAIDNEQQEQVQIEQFGESNYLIQLDVDDAMLVDQAGQPAASNIEFDFLINTLSTPSEFDVDPLLSQLTGHTETDSPLFANSSLETPELQANANFCPFSSLAMGFPINNLPLDGWSASSDPSFQPFLDFQSTLPGANMSSSSLVGDQSTLVNSVQTLRITEIDEETTHPLENNSVSLQYSSVHPMVSQLRSHELHGRAEDTETYQSLPLVKKRTRRKFREIERGNNRYGRAGNLRCDACRRRRSKCVFTNELVTCEYCRLRNVKEPCIKRRGPGTEKVLNPDRDIIIPDDCKVNGEDGMMYQYALSGSPELVYPGIYYIAVMLWRKFRAGYGGFIPCASLRHAILAAAYLQMSSVYGESKIIEHHNKAFAALRKLTHETLDDGDLLATYILYLNSRSMKRRREMSEHLKGLAILSNHLDSKDRESGVVGQLAVLRPMISLVITWSPSYARQYDYNCLAALGNPRQIANANAELLGIPAVCNLASNLASPWPWHLALWQSFIALMNILRGRNTKDAAAHESDNRFASALATLTMQLRDRPFNQIQGVLDQVFNALEPVGPFVTERCLLYLAVDLLLRIMAVGPFSRAFDTPDIITGAWLLVRVILCQKRWCHQEWIIPNSRSIKVLFFLGSLFLTAGNARDTVQASILAFLRSGFRVTENEITDDDGQPRARVFKKDHDMVSMENADIILLWFWEVRDVEGIFEIIFALLYEHVRP